MRNCRCITIIQGLFCFCVLCGEAQEPVFLAGSKPAVLTFGESKELELIIRNHGKSQSIHFHGLKESEDIVAHPSDGGGSDNWVVHLTHGMEEGVYSYHVGTSHGVSNPAFLILSAWPSILEKELLEASSPMPVQTWVCGEVGAGSEDVYPVNLESGRFYSIGVMARGLGSRLRAVLGLRDSMGRLLHEVQMGELIEGVSVPVSGQYMLSVSDHSFEGGDQYFYEAVIVPGEKMPQPWREEMKSLLYRRGPQSGTIPELPQGNELSDLMGASPGSDSIDRPWHQVPAMDPAKSVGIRSSWTDGRAPFRVRYRTNSSGKYRVEVVSSRMGVPSIPRLTLFRLGSDVSGAGIETNRQVAEAYPGVPAYKYGGLNFDHCDPALTFSADKGEEFGIMVEDTGVPVAEYGTKSFYLIINRIPGPPVGRIILQPLPYIEPNKRQLYPFPLNLLPGQRIPLRVRTLPLQGAVEDMHFHLGALPTGLEYSPSSLAWSVMGGESVVLLSASSDAAAAGSFAIQPSFKEAGSGLIEVFGTFGPQWRINDFNSEYAEASLVRKFYGSVVGGRIAPLVARLHSGGSDLSGNAGDGLIEIKSGEARTLTLELLRTGHFTGEVTFKGYGPWSKLPDVKVGAGENSASLVIDTGKLGWKPGDYSPFMHASIKSVIPNADTGDSVEQDKKEYIFDVYTSAPAISVTEAGGESYPVEVE